jgi:hypothetical protein
VRTTTKDIERRLRYFNELIAEQGIVVRLEGRYGYHALDLYRLDGECLKTVATGMTTGETLRHLEAMLNGIELYTYDD